MPLTTCTVRCALSDQNGQPLAGAVITATLNRYEVYQGHVVPRATTAVTAADGTAQLALWPNALGAVESAYDIAIQPSGGTVFRTTAVVPNLASTDLHLISELSPYPGMTNGQLLIDTAADTVTTVLAAKDTAVASANDAGMSATNAATSAASASTSASSAAASAAAAATSESNAEASASNAATLESNAATSATAAANSATAAATSATNASDTVASLAAAGGSTLVGHGSETVAQALDARLPEIGTYELLRAYTGPLTAFHVICREQIFDGAHGDFRVVEGDTTSANNGGTILVDALGRRWKREFNGLIRAAWFGAKGDGVTDDADALDDAAVVASGGWVLLDEGKTYRITRPLTDSVVLRFTGPAPVKRYEGSPTDGDRRPVILCDGAAIRGIDDPDASTNGRALNLKGLRYLHLKAAGGAKYAAHFNCYEGHYEGLWLDGFAHYGLWARGGGLALFRDIYASGCGLGLASNGQINSRNYRAGCGLLIECSNTASEGGGYDAGRNASGNYRPTTITLDNVWCDDLTARTTSPHGIISFGVIGLNMRNCGGYDGSWLSWCTGRSENLYEETYASGGAVAGDGVPFSLYEYDNFMTHERTALTAAHRRIRALAFNAANDYAEYERSTTSGRRMSRAQIFELILGADKPDASSTAWQAYAAKGTTDNPSLIYDATQHALMGSRGNAHYPWVGFPIYTAGTVAGGGGTASVDRNVVAPTSGADGFSYEVEVRVGSGAALIVSWWRLVRTSTYARWVKLGEINPSGLAVTIAEDAAGNLRNLVITNSTGGVLNWAANGRVLSVGSFAPSN